MSPSTSDLDFFPACPTNLVPLRLDDRCEPLFRRRPPTVRRAGPGPDFFDEVYSTAMTSALVVVVVVMAVVIIEFQCVPIFTGRRRRDIERRGAGRQPIGASVKEESSVTSVFAEFLRLAPVTR